MPRKSTGGASAASAPSTPAAKGGPRKSVGTPSGADSESSSSNPALIIPPAAKSVLKQQETAQKGIEAFDLPRTNIVKLAKSDIPDSVQLRKEVQQALVKSATVFISYLSAAAHERVAGKGGKIISAQHVLEAVKEVELDSGDGEVLRELKDQLRAYRENAARKKSEKAAGVGTKGTSSGPKDREVEDGDADVSRFDGAEDGEEGDDSVMPDGEDEGEAGDESLLRKSLQNGNQHDDDEEEEDEGEDQLMDED
ncbi:related to dna polymerase epsilon p17 subunit [Ustilago trichophora]|uniref:DNA polymerase epsilon subunit D n=1 Tax=Ustilago trichophora TaxID=86804 RepID=A0A5C3EAU8_9BASI|nr:related to dna polymerase epsilon p17 subunit [Ustilago trichophora]